MAHRVAFRQDPVTSANFDRALPFADNGSATTSQVPSPQPSVPTYFNLFGLYQSPLQVDVSSRGIHISVATASASGGVQPPVDREYEVVVTMPPRERHTISVRIGEIRMGRPTTVDDADY